jgi:hypothetical protein
LRLLLFQLAFLSALAAQEISAPRIGIIDFYGLRKVSEQQIRKALAFKEGSVLPPSKGDVEERLEEVPNVVGARLEATCCEEGKAILYIGVEEKGAPHFEYLDIPGGEVRLSQDIHDEYAGFLAAVNAAVRSGTIGESLADGHSLMNDGAARRHQERFIELARGNLQLLRDVLRESGSEEHRAIAAYVIGYAPNKKDVVDDLQRALRDTDDTVRNNAMRSLAAIAVLGSRDAEQGIKVSPTWFIEMLDSLVWADRSAAAVALVTLTESRPPNVLGHIRERALPSLSEMARWKHLPHALPAFILVGRAHGVSEADIQTAWSSPSRIGFLDGLLKPLLLKPAKK